MGKVVEYDSAGKESGRTRPGIATWSAERLKNGNTLIAGARMVREVNPAERRSGSFRPRTCRTTCSTRCRLRSACPMGTRSSIPGSTSGWGGRCRHGSRSGAGNHARQEDRLGVARVGEPGGSGTRDHHPVTGCAKRPRGGAFRRLEITGRRNGGGGGITSGPLCGRPLGLYQLLNLVLGQAQRDLQVLPWVPTTSDCARAAASGCCAV